jgi:Ca-activated chloride channel family protein
VAASCGGSPVPSRVETGFGRGTFGAALSAAKLLRGTGGSVFASVQLSALDVEAGPRPPLDIALVIDRSGSMEEENKLVRAKEAALGLVDRLGDKDRIALVQYDDAAQIVVPSIPVDREGKARLRKAIQGLEPGGSTNLHGGMTLGRDEVKRTLQPGAVSRVILLSDGLANAGISDPATIADTARAAADQGVRITTVGVGVEYNEDLMESIAEAGRGHYYYVRDAGSLEKVLAGELSAAQATVATGVELRLRPACSGVEISDVLGYDHHQDGDTTVVPLADLFGADHRSMVVSVKVPDRVAGNMGAIVATLRYRDARSGETSSKEIALGVEVTDDFHAVDASVDRDVMAQVLKAQAATTMRAAAAAYSKGDVAGAEKLARDKNEEMKEAVGHYHLDAAMTAPAMSSLSGFAAQAGEASVGSDEGKDLVKQTKATARALSKGQQ